MSNGFDAYHKWLSIPPHEQPPNHYRLLGLGLFESDPDVVAAAADRQMAHVQTYKTGPHSELSQKLLNEISAAKLCLLRPQRNRFDAGNFAQQLGVTWHAMAPTIAGPTVPPAGMPAPLAGIPPMGAARMSNPAALRMSIPASDTAHPPSGAMTGASLRRARPAGMPYSGFSNASPVAPPPPASSLPGGRRAAAAAPRHDDDSRRGRHRGGFAVDWDCHGPWPSQ